MKKIWLGSAAVISLLILFTIRVPVFADDTPTPTPTVTDTPTPTPTPSSGCWDPAPGGSKQLTSAVSAGPHTITLTWTDASDPVTYYLISYGLSAGQYIYGNPNVGGQGTTSYTVGGLATGKKYYFVVRAGNGCTPGTFSNELSAVPGESPTPTATSSGTLTDTTNLGDQQPTATPEIPTNTPTPTTAPEVLAAQSESSPSGSNTFVRYLMLSATIVGILLAVVGTFLFLRMKKRQP